MPVDRRAHLILRGTTLIRDENTPLLCSVRVKCSPQDTVGDLKKLIAAQSGTDHRKIQRTFACAIACRNPASESWVGYSRDADYQTSFMIASSLQSRSLITSSRCVAPSS